MTAAEISEYIRKLVDAAPPIGPSQRVQLAALLRPDLPVGIRKDATTTHRGKAA